MKKDIYMYNIYKLPALKGTTIYTV